MNVFRSHVRWLLILWTFVISAIAYLDRGNISIAGRVLKQEFRRDHVQLERSDAVTTRIASLKYDGNLRHPERTADEQAPRV